MIFIGLLYHEGRAQQEVRFDVKINNGNAISCIQDNINTALTSGREIKIVKNGSGLETRTLRGHSGTVLTIDSNKNGELLISGSKDKGAIIWNLENGLKIQQLDGHQKAVIGTSFIGLGKCATIGADNNLMIWDAEQGKRMGTYQDHSADLTALATSDQLVVTGAKDGTIVTRYAEKDSIVYSGYVNNAVSSIEFSTTGNRIFVGQNEGSITILNPITGEIIGEIDAGKGTINSLSVTNDNNYLVVSSRDCSIYNLQDMSIVKRIDKVSSSIVDAAITPDGQHLFFIEDAAPKAQSWDVSDLNIAYVVNVKDEEDKAAPQIYISSPAKIVDNRVVYYDYLLKLSGSVIDNYGIQLLKVNGVVTPVKQSGNFVMNLPLTMGDNFITIEVTDVNQNTSIKKFVVTRKDMEGVSYDPAEAKNYLLVVGINKYEHWPQLYNAVKDANDVVNTLMSMYNFEFSDITLITDEQATRSNLYNTLRNFVGEVGPKDNFMIYYSGHGHFDEVLNEGYWVPSDARLDQTGDYLSNSDISKIIGNIDSQHTFLVADACYSGSLFNESSRGYSENVERFKSRWGLASGRLETVSDGQVGANSPFARTFINYLKRNDDEKIAVSQIVQHVKVEVAENIRSDTYWKSLEGSW